MLDSNSSETTSSSSSSASRSTSEDNPTKSTSTTTTTISDDTSTSSCSSSSVAAASGIDAAAVDTTANASSLNETNKARLSKASSLSRSSSFKTAVETPNKIQAIVFTNTDDLDNLNTISNDTADSPAILYENDFDLYSLLKEMIKVPKSLEHEENQQAPQPQLSYNSEQMSQAKNKIIYKNYTKLLTAQLNDINFTDGKAKWFTQGNFNPMYSKNIKCIGTNPADFVHSESIFLDLQPLSTRIKLMCKLVIIIQGACVERFGPPKLVQDRCIQFDGDHELKPKSENSAAAGSPIDVTANNFSDSQTNLSKLIKSNSCEDLLLETSKTSMTTTTTRTTDDGGLIISKNLTNNENIVYKRKRQDSAPNIIEKAFENDDDETKDAKSYSKKHYDLENYYRHRMSRYSLKDYASLPYYQYSRRVVKRLDKAVNTDESFLTSEFNEKVNSTVVESSQKVLTSKDTVVDNATTVASSSSNNKKDSSTSTSDLIDDFYLGYYSKSQLLSPFSLYRTQSTLWNSYTNTGAMSASVDNLQQQQQQQHKKTTEYYYSYSKEYFVTSKEGTPPPPPVHVSGITIQTSDLASLRQRPLRSANWSLFNKSHPERTTVASSSSSTEMINHHSFHHQQHSSPRIPVHPSEFRFFPPFKYVQQPPPVPPRAPAPPLPPRSSSTSNVFRAAKF